MNENPRRETPILKMKNPVWKVEVVVFYPISIDQLKKETEKKLWKTKVILN